MVLETRPANSIQELKNNQPPEKSNPSAEGGLTFSDEQRQKMVALLGTLITWRILSLLHSCVDCGLCTDACHYFKATNNPRLIPASKMKRLTRILKKYRVILRNKTPWSARFNYLNEQEAIDIYRTVFEDCSLCGRCGMACPMGLNAGPIFLTVRAMFSQIKKVPKGLDEPVEMALKQGNYVGLSTEDLTETLEWIAEEMGDELKVEGFSIPVDKKNADFLYIPHPLELRDNPFLISAAITVLHAAQANYTFSSRHFDVANYAYYAGNSDYMLQIVKNLVQAKVELEAKDVVLTPCGHGYRVLRWEAERILGYRFPFKVHTFTQTIDRFIREGRLTIKKDTIEGPITYHDPCNIARYGAVIEEPRNILGALTSNFVEMEPHGAWNYCCGGGGGLAATGEYGKIRMEMGKVKAEQIQKTGAKVVATNCYNCRTQISELNTKYKLGVKVKSIVELVADSLDVSEKEK